MLSRPLGEDALPKPFGLFVAEEHGLVDELTIFAVPFDKYVSNDDNAHVTISSWRRLDDNAIPARGKISGAYANSALIKTDAVRAGFDEALVLTRDGHISEGSAMNFFMIRNGVLVTPPVTENILEGITRAAVLKIAEQELGLEVVERPIDRTEVFLCEEVFMSGTAAQITAVTRVVVAWLSVQATDTSQPPGPVPSPGVKL